MNRELTDRLMVEFFTTCAHTVGHPVHALSREELLSLFSFDIGQTYYVDDEIKYSKDFAHNGLFVLKFHSQKGRYCTMIWRTPAGLWSAHHIAWESYDEFSGNEKR